MSSLIVGAVIFLVGAFLGWLSALLSVQFGHNLVFKNVKTEPGIGEDTGD